MKNLPNIDKSKFHPRQYIGYGGCAVWRVKRVGNGAWTAYADRDRSLFPDRGVLSADLLKDISAKLAALEPNSVPPAPRCELTIDMFTGRAG